MVDLAVPSEAEPVGEADACRGSTATSGERPGDDLVQRVLRGNLLSRAEARALDASGQPLQPSELRLGDSVSTEPENMCWRWISSLTHIPWPPPWPRRRPRPDAPPPDRRQPDLPDDADV